ncbi:MAG: murein L,D-transpeptidase catalytic domain family protein [Cyclobacteriaceae bacterium]
MMTIFMLSMLSLFISYQQDISPSGVEISTLQNQSGTDSLLEKLSSQVKEDSSLQEALKQGLIGYKYFSKEKTLNSQLVIIDFTKPSDQKRFYIFDLTKEKIVHSDHVAHGKNSGLTYANSFSNQRHSNSSSLGFYRTAETYRGKHGLSLRLDGLETGINHNARERAIVMHSAKYANPDFIEKYGRLGRSFGCPALPEKDYSRIIDLIKEGSLLFIYHPDETYIQKSQLF